MNNLLVNNMDQEVNNVIDNIEENVNEVEWECCWSWNQYSSSS